MVSVAHDNRDTRNKMHEIVNCPNYRSSGPRPAPGRQPPRRANPCPPAQGQDQARIHRRAVADAAGPFNALGATLFWGAWAYKFDRARLDRNLEALSGAGIDYIRVLGSVGGDSWEDRQTDPRWEDYDAIIAGVTDLAYDRYGVRVQWTLFGGRRSRRMPGPASRSSIGSRPWRAVASTRSSRSKSPMKAGKMGFRAPKASRELRRLGKRLGDQTTASRGFERTCRTAPCATPTPTPAPMP